MTSRKRKYHEIKSDPPIPVTKKIKLTDDQQTLIQLIGGVFTVVKDNCGVDINDNKIDNQRYKMIYEKIRNNVKLTSTEALFICSDEAYILKYDDWLKPIKTITYTDNLILFKFLVRTINLKYSVSQKVDMLCIAMKHARVSIFQHLLYHLENDLKVDIKQCLMYRRHINRQLIQMGKNTRNKQMICNSITILKLLHQKWPFLLENVAARRYFVLGFHLHVFEYFQFVIDIIGQSETMKIFDWRFKPRLIFQWNSAHPKLVDIYLQEFKNANISKILHTNVNLTNTRFLFSKLGIMCKCESIGQIEASSLHLIHISAVDIKTDDDQKIFATRIEHLTPYDLFIILMYAIEKTNIRVVKTLYPIIVENNTITENIKINLLSLSVVIRLNSKELSKFGSSSKRFDQIEQLQLFQYFLNIYKCDLFPNMNENFKQSFFTNNSSFKVKGYYPNALKFHLSVFIHSMSTDLDEKKCSNSNSLTGTSILPKINYKPIWFDYHGRVCQVSLVESIFKFRSSHCLDYLFDTFPELEPKMVGDANYVNILFHTKRHLKGNRIHRSLKKRFPHLEWKCFSNFF